MPSDNNFNISQAVEKESTKHYRSPKSYCFEMSQSFEILIGITKDISKTLLCYLTFCCDLRTTPGTMSPGPTLQTCIVSILKYPRYIFRTETDFVHALKITKYRLKSAITNRAAM